MNKPSTGERNMSIPDQERHGVPEAMFPPPGREQDKSSRWFILMAGVILPAFTLAYEAYTQASAQSFFDPIPSLLHGLLIALVPLANAWVLVGWHDRLCAAAHRWPGCTRLRWASPLSTHCSICR